MIGTFRMLSQLPNDSLGAYIISMSHTASDVLAVVLLQKECGGERGLCCGPGGAVGRLDCRKAAAVGLPVVYREDDVRMGRACMATA